MARNWFAYASLAAFAAILLFGCMGPDYSASGVAATAVAGGIQVSWNPVSGVAGYNVYRSTAQGTLGDRANPALIAGATSYKDVGVSDGTTYYYTVKGVDASGKEYGNAQASATARVAPPRGLALTINGGSNHTSSRAVTLYVTVAGASQCRFSNDGAAWGDWQAFSATTPWSLGTGDGQKQAYAQCRDDLGNTGQPVSASIYLSTVPPTMTVKSPVEGAEYAGSFDAVFTATSPVSSTLACSVKLDGVLLETSLVDAGVENNFTVPAAPGRHTAYIECSDSVLSTNKTATFTVTDKPRITLFVLGDGSGYTATQSVNVDINASLASQCRFSNDGINWNNWGAYTPVFTWTLTGGEGTKTVYAQCRSASGLVTDTLSDLIILDTSPPPYISVSINNGARRINSREVTLGLYAFAASQCRFANDNTNAWGAWEPYTTRKAWSLSVSDGTKTVYYNCKKANGDDVGTASAAVDMYQVPPGPPTNMDVQINGGDASTSSRNVDLTLHAEKASECRLSQDNYAWTDWADYTTHATMALQGSDGTKTVYYQCRNDYGTQSVYSTIYYESQPPYDLSVQINGGEQSTSSRQVTLYLHASHATSCKYREEGYDWSGWESYTTSRSFTLSSGDGRKVIDYQCKNGQGTSGTATASIYLSTAPPPPITDLYATASEDRVRLSWSSPGGSVRRYHIYRSNVEFGLFTELTTTTSASYTDHEVAAGSTYAYTVKSEDQSGQLSGDSNVATAEVPIPAPPPN